MCLSAYYIDHFGCKGKFGFIMNPKCFKCEVVTSWSIVYSCVLFQNETENILSSQVLKNVSLAVFLSSSTDNLWLFIIY